MAKRERKSEGGKKREKSLHMVRMNGREGKRKNEEKWVGEKK